MNVIIKTGLREIRQYLSREGSLENKNRFQLYYVKPFPPNLYLKIIGLCGSVVLYENQESLKNQWKLKVKTNILLKDNGAK